MLAYLKGIVTEKKLQEPKLFLEVGSMAFEIHTNLKTLNSLDNNHSYKIYTHLISREDGQKLFGFIDQASKEIFAILISVSGIGPKAAMNILNILSIEQLISAVVNDKPKLLSEAPGVGLKTAQKIILELNNKLAKFAEIQHQSQTNYSSTQEATTILNNLGYALTEIDGAITEAEAQGIEDDAELLVRFCLQALT